MTGHETTGRPLLTAVEYVLEQLVKLYGRTRTHNEKESPSLVPRPHTEQG